MNDPLGQTPATSPHPRRPPAHKSVSLRHSPTAARPSNVNPQTSSYSSPNGPASDKANPPSTVSPKILNKHSSGESSDAGKWFENTNNNAVQSKASFVDNDPPFFLRNSSSSNTPPEGYDHRADAFGTESTSLPYRPGYAQLGTDGSSTEDFRGVIDDLTVTNKRLRQRLKKYEKMYDAHLQDEKLFEVRFHGLPDHKKKELEETLRKFASGLDDSSSREYPQISHAPALEQQKTNSSTSRFADSGFASMSASGQGLNPTAPPSGRSEQSGQHGDHRKMSKSQFNRQQASIQSYLHDIPAGLLPKPHVAMTNKTKKKLIVRRLEQIFAGKASMPGSHPQPMQQEEVAQSAAMADRQAKEARGQQSRKEGLREARIMPVQSEDDDIISQPHFVENLQKLRPQLNIQEQDFAGGSNSPDQRPTRPLDLDPFRAQIPAENMEYIRHLGFTPPNMATGDAPLDGHGWIYLNLLINMAQLHTINVTPDFVKDAVTEYSSMFELSHDGRKIRWKGGHEVTKHSDGSSSEHPSSTSSYYSSIKSPNKRIKTGHSGESSGQTDVDRTARRAAHAMKQHDQKKLMYTPLFFHKEESDDEEDFYNFDINSSSNSPLPTQQRGDSSGLGSSAMRSSSSRRRREDGPMIFYNKAKFCTDLSGDRRGQSVADPASYNSITSQPIGATSHALRTSIASGINEKRGPLNTLKVDDYSSVKDGATSSGSDLDGFSPDALKNDDGDSPDAMDFEASGLGGVQPEDNFSISVRRSQTQTGNTTQYAAQRQASKARLYSSKIIEALKEQSSEQPSEADTTKAESVIKEQILSANRKDLPSSILPPASFLPFDSTSSGDVDSDLESDVSSDPEPTESSDRGPATALRLLNISPAHRSSNDDYGSDETDADSADQEHSSDDGSVDLLATARAQDPLGVRKSEREYDAALADRLAEEIPAGSSAATAGGGSGFNSPAAASDIAGLAEIAGKLGHAKGQGIGSESSFKKSTTSGSSAARRQGMKRSRTSDSLATKLPKDRKRERKE